MDLEILQQRAAIIKNIRSFFDNKNYLELDTPLLCPDLIPESCLEVFETKRLYPNGSRKENSSLYLIPSPEIWMKKIIAKHRVNVFQICKCFRNGESIGRLHNHEFTMLEYYTMDAGYMDSLALTEELFNFLTANHKDEEFLPRTTRTIAFGTNHTNEKFLFERITVAEAFKKYAGFDLFEAAAQGADSMAAQAKKLGLEPMPDMTVAQLYDLIFIHAVEPHLKTDKPFALLDYPAFVPCLAKLSANGQTVERWELYWDGIELANCFSEETNAQNVKEFFINEEAKLKQRTQLKQCAQKDKDAVVLHKVDHDYWKIFENFPRCSGVAIGLDRLIMALLGKQSIDGVMVT
ncbi:MAG: LysR family transcriptional regulator [Treponema sp.]|nr:LysR family transcriptional regulator [Treponema sp.]MCL2238115.1 LysR family transcriptional regulator [Treponema sp.]